MALSYTIDTPDWIRALVVEISLKWRKDISILKCFLWNLFKSLLSTRSLNKTSWTLKESVVLCRCSNLGLPTLPRNYEKGDWREIFFSPVTFYYLRNWQKSFQSFFSIRREEGDIVGHSIWGLFFNASLPVLLRKNSNVCLFFFCHWIEKVTRS